MRYKGSDCFSAEASAMLAGFTVSKFVCGVDCRKMPSVQPPPAINAPQLDQFLGSVAAKAQADPPCSVARDLAALVGLSTLPSFPFRQSFAETGFRELLLSTFLSTEALRSASFALIANLSLHPPYAASLIDAGVISSLVDTIKSHSVLSFWCLANFAAIDGVRSLILDNISLDNIESLFYQRPVRPMVQHHILRLFLNFASFPLSVELFENLTSLLVRLCESSTAAPDPLLLYALAILSDFVGFTELCQATAFPAFLSAMLTSTNARLLRPSLHILRNVVRDLDLAELADVPRLVSILGSPFVPPQIVVSVCGVFAVLLNRMPATVRPAVPAILQTLRVRVEGDSFLSQTACLYCLARMLQEFPAEFGALVDADFVAVICRYLESEDAHVGACAMALLGVLLEHAPAQLPAFAAADGWERLAELVSGESAELARHAAGFARRISERMPGAVPASFG
jgi:hypothetical protein